MNNTWLQHIIAVLALAVFIVLGLASASKPEPSSKPISNTGGTAGNTPDRQQQQTAPKPVQTAQATPPPPPAPLYWTGEGGKGLSLAVLEPTGKGLAAPEQWMLPLIQGSLTGDFNRYSAMTIVDRLNLEKILAEQTQSMSGIYSDDDYIRIGRLTNARLILAGSITKTANTFMLELSVTDAESGERKASYPPKSVSPASVENLSAIKEAVADLLDQLGVTLTDRSLQALKKPVAITVVQGQAALSMPVAQTAQQQATQQQTDQNQLSEAQTQLAEVQAQIALAKGIAAQRQGTVVEALSYFIQAANFNPAMTEAASRMNIMKANISSGNIGVDTRNEIAWRRQWVTRLQEAETFFANYVKTPQPYNMVYSTDIQKGAINWQNETIALSFAMILGSAPADEAAWKDPINGVISAVKEGLAATGRAGAWELNWPGSAARIIGLYSYFAVVAEIINDKGISIGRQTVSVPYGYGMKDGIITEFRRWRGTVSFSVKADDITDTLTIRISSIDSIPAETASRQKNINILPLAEYRKLFPVGPAGGIVFYDKGSVSDGWRYLEAAPAGTEFEAKWGGTGMNITGTDTNVGSGRRNTQLIIAALGRQAQGSAAQRCAGLNVGGKTDWFLPSLGELDLMYKNLGLYGLGGFSGEWYWSSSQGANSDNVTAWAQRFSDGSQDDYYKYYDYFVRAVRAF